MKTLAIDIETYSSTDLSKSGVYKYTEAADFTILMIACSFDNGEVEIYDLTDVPKDAKVREASRKVFNALLDPTILKTAFNANFERTCLQAYFQKVNSNCILPPEQWECTMVKSAMLGLPLSLEAVGNVLKLTARKDSKGKALISYFSKPCKPTKTNGMRTRNLPEHAPEKWQAFLDYCVQDVRTELAIRNKISFFEIPEKEKALWCLDQRINDRGILLDREFINAAIQMSEVNTARLTEEAIRLTGLSNPNSAAQLKTWLSNETGSEVETLRKGDIPALLEASECEHVSRVLEIRQEMAKTSVKKYTSMLNGICDDNRVRGLLQYYGANRTGRWAGRLVQVQNLPQNHLHDLDLARQLVKSGDIEMVEMMFGNVPNVLSELIRTAFVAPSGRRFIVADFSAIEARVIAWLASEKWRLDVFNTHGKIYEASAAQMFRVPIESVTKGSGLRQRGKIAELALGYQGGANALTSMEDSLRVPANERVPEEEKPQLVSAWRLANPAIVKLWKKVENAAIECVSSCSPVQIMHGIRFEMSRGILFIKLPSGRCLSYLSPKLKTGKFGGEALTYEGMDQTTKQWKRQDTYGGKLVENLVQAIARDCLAESMLRLTSAGYDIAIHVHDENVLEAPNDFGSLDDVNKIMSESIAWAPGLPLTADSYETNYYRKD